MNRRKLLFGCVTVLCMIWLSTHAMAVAPYPGTEWPTATPASQGMDSTKLAAAKNYALTGGGAGLIIRNGYKVYSWGNQTSVTEIKSATKGSAGTTALGLAIKDGKVGLDDLAIIHDPAFGTPPIENAEWADEVTLFDLATHTAGFKKPGGYITMLCRPGTCWNYSDGGANWLAETLTKVYREDLKTLLFRRVFKPLGIPSAQLTWRRNSYRPKTIDGIENREFGAGISASVNALARIGLLYLRGGVWKSQQILPKSFVAMVRKTPEETRSLREAPDSSGYGNASVRHGLLWWNNADGEMPNIPRDAYWTRGLGDRYIFVILSLDLVIARNGNAWKSGPTYYAPIQKFLQPIVDSVK
jgi:CubicO group peptidase (beta-lactamase class C family)